MKQIGLRGIGIAAASLFFPAACGGDATGPLPPCTGAIEVRAVSGVRPVFEWTPRCGLGSINVVAGPSLGGGDGNMWVLLSAERPIGPRLRYGDRPRGTVTQTPARTLTTGRDYVAYFAAERGSSPIAVISWRP